MQRFALGARRTSFAARTSLAVSIVFGLFGALGCSPKRAPAPNPSGPSERFALYGGDDNAEQVIVKEYVEIPAAASLQEKLTRLAGALSEKEFSGLPLSVLRIDERPEGRVAVIAIGESAENSPLLAQQARLFDGNRDGEAMALEQRLTGKLWCRHYFQGSTGGSMTTGSLRTTFLQPEYPGPWIDALEFYYEGAPMDTWDHVSLDGLILRKAALRE